MFNLNKIPTKKQIKISPNVNKLHFTIFTKYFCYSLFLLPCYWFLTGEIRVGNSIINSSEYRIISAEHNVLEFYLVLLSVTILFIFLLKFRLYVIKNFPN